MRYIDRIILTLGMLALPAMAMAQNDDSQKKSEIKLNNLDVIYEEEEFKGVTVDQKDKRGTETDLYMPPFVVMPLQDEEDEENDLPQTFNLSDDGAESEDEILWEAFDTSMIHQPKLDPATITEPIMLQLSKFTWPTPVTARPSSHFGPRRRRWHYGLDLAQPTGEPIYAAFDGVVRISKFNRSYGNLVIIHHSNGLETYYAHMSKRHVSAGDQVKSGDIIGLCGNTGRSYGSHLHFEIRYMGNAMNPENVIDCSTHDLIDKTLTITSSSFRKVAKGGKTSSGTATASSGWYRVRQGDTLEKIARRNGTTVKRLCQLNGISQNKVLHPGDRLKVSGSATSSKPSQASTSSQTSQSGGQGATHTVRKGETLYSIARANGTTVKKLCQLNGISENATLRVGQKLKVK